MTDPTSAERPPKGVRSGYRKSVNQVPEGTRGTPNKSWQVFQVGGREALFLKIGSFKMLKRLLMENWHGGMVEWLRSFFGPVRKL